MRRLLLLLLSLLLFTPPAFADVGSFVYPGECKFFNAVTAGSDRDSEVTFAKPFEMRLSKHLAVHLIWASLTGSVDATVQVYVSNDPALAAGSWVAKSSATFTLSGASGSQIISLANVHEAWAKVVYTHNSVSGGTLTGYCMVKP